MNRRSSQSNVQRLADLETKLNTMNRLSTLGQLTKLDKLSELSRSRRAQVKLYDKF